MINYVQKFAGGKVSIEVSDPADIYKLSTLYADGSEARVVNVDSELYRLINGQWEQVFPDPVIVDSDVFVIKLIAGSYSNRQYSDITLSKSLEEIMEAARKNKTIIVQFQYSNPNSTVVKSMFSGYSYTESRVDLSAHFHTVEDPADPGAAYDYLLCTITCISGQDSPQVIAERLWR